MRSKALNKIIHIATQEGAATEAYFCRAMAENIMRIKTHQVRVGHRVDRHAGNHPYSQPKPHIGFNDVGIGSGKDNARR